MSKNNKLGQAGMVSILVTMIMMIVITLIVLGFAQVARRNQREALDRQLSTQAFYAAETGVNDVVNLVSASKYNPATDTTTYNSCKSGDPNNFLTNPDHALTPNLNPPDNTIGYTCLLVTPLVPSIDETVSPGDSKVVPVDPSSVTPLTFTWQANTSGADAATCPTNTGSINTFLPSGASSDGNNWQSTNCQFGILRIDLFDAGANPTPTTPTDMANDTQAFYFVPTNATTVPTVTLGSWGGATVVAAACNVSTTPGTCSATIKTGDANSKSYYARESAIYESLNDVSITGGANVTFSNAQLLIDSTGKAQDELKRIQVRIDLSGTNSAPGYALQSGDLLCKQFLTFGTGYLAGSTTAGGADSDIPSELCSSGGD